MTHEWDFPGGSAIVTDTTTGGPADFCVSGLDGTDFEGEIKRVFAEEILRLKGQLDSASETLAIIGDVEEGAV